MVPICPMLGIIPVIIPFATVMGHPATQSRMQLIMMTGGGTSTHWEQHIGAELHTRLTVKIGLKRLLTGSMSF